MTKHDGVNLRHWPAPQTHNTSLRQRTSLKICEKIDDPTLHHWIMLRGLCYPLKRKTEKTEGVIIFY